MSEGDEAPVEAEARTPFWKRVLKLSLFTLLVASPIWSGWFARRIMFPGAETPLPATAPADWEAQGLSLVDYTTEDGVALRGVAVVSTARAPRPALVFFHGNGASAADSVELGRWFQAAGCDVFLAEYRGYGGCAGSPSEAGLLRDGRAALRAAVQALQVPRERLILSGMSFGAAVAAAMAAEGHGRGVILFCPYTSTVDLAEKMVPRWLARIAVHDTFDSRARLQGARHPVLIAHGEADALIPVTHGKALAASLGERARLVLLPGATHNLLRLPADRRTVRAAIRAFLRGLP